MDDKQLLQMLEKLGKNSLKDHSQSVGRNSDEGRSGSTLCRYKLEKLLQVSLGSELLE